MAAFPLLGLATLLGQSAGTVEPGKVDGPKAKFAEARHDFGKVAPSEPQQHDFIVTNVGSAPLLISDVRPGCGCTTASDWDREIAPGQSGKIPIGFNPANFNGSVTKSIIVTTNDAEQPTQLLEIHATVWRRLDVTPTFTTFLPVAGEPAKETKIVRITNHADEELVLDAPQSTSADFKPELKTIRPGKEFELHVTYETDAPKTTPAATISIKTNYAAQPVLNVSALAMPQPAIVAIPTAITLPEGGLEAGYTHNVVIRSNASAPLEVTEPKASTDEIAVKISEAQPGKVFYVNVTLPQNFKTSKESPAFVSVKTSHPRYPEIRIQILPPLGAMSAVGRN